MKRDLASTFVVLQPDQRAALIENSLEVLDDLDRRFSGFKGHVLIATFAFDADWTTWERHPAGDELVCLLSGSATLVLDRDGARETIELQHTARTNVPTNMLLVTPGEGTENKPV
jgi:hypothetical protein